MERSWAGEVVPMPIKPSAEFIVEKESKGTLVVEVAKLNTFILLLSIVVVAEVL